MIDMETNQMTKLQKAQVEVKRLWALMCAAENVPVDSKFVVFNDANPFSADYNKAVKRYFVLRGRATKTALRKSYQTSAPAKLALQYSPAQWKAAVR
jgi:hypothetical protein